MSIVLALGSLSCGHCIKSVTKAIEKISGEGTAQVTLNFAKIDSDKAPELFIQAIIDADFEAKLAQPSFTLVLSGLNCGHCIKSTEKALSAVSNIDVFEVSKTEAKIYGNALPEEAIAAITEAGFEASLKPNLLTESTSLNLDWQSTESEIAPTSPEPVLVENQAQAVFQTQGDFSQTTLIINGMSCAACVAKVQKALEALVDVSKAQINLAERTALVFGEADPQLMIEAVKNAGYEAEVVIDENLRREKQNAQINKEINERKWQSIFALIAGFGLFFWGILGGQMMATIENHWNWVGVGVVSCIVMWLTGRHFYQSAWRNLLKGNATMDTLVALGTGVAWLYSMLIALNPEFFPEAARHLYFESSTMIIGLINLGKMLESKAKKRSSTALERLLDLTPKTAVVIENDKVREIPLSEVQQNMILRLQTGDRVSVDGSITQGLLWVDESMLTGESLPVEKQMGDKVSAGTMIIDGAGLCQAEQIGSQTRLANIIKLVRQAQSSKPQIGLLADKIASVFVPVVIAIALVSSVIWWFLGPEPKIAYSLTVLTTVLIIACPCALGLATPMSIIAGVGRAAELGILVRDADSLQKSSEVDTLVFDKTGTLTQGEPMLTQAVYFQNISELEALGFALSLEANANHPLAKAVLAYGEQKLTTGQYQSAVSNSGVLQNFRTLKGLGVAASYKDQNLILGNRTLLEDQDIGLTEGNEFFISQSQQGATVVFLAVNQRLVAMFAIRDQLREDTSQALQRLHKQGYHLVMLTGDQQYTAKAIAKEAGIDEVVAGVLPEGKAKIIQQLQSQGKKVMMIGDGINDAPALAQANVSIAMGSGSDIAIETADLTLMRHSIHAVADSLALSKGTLTNMKQNLFAAFVYNSLGIPLAAGLFYPIFGILLNPMIGGMAMALSSISVATNANRLLKFKPKE